MSIEKRESEEATKDLVDTSTLSEMSKWFREQGEDGKQLKSNDGTTCTDIDRLVANWVTGGYIMLEEKCKCRELESHQIKYFKKIDALLDKDPEFLGFWVVKFEDTRPDNGRIWIAPVRYLGYSDVDTSTLIMANEQNRYKYSPYVKVTERQLIKFLKLEWKKGVLNKWKDKNKKGEL